MKESSDTKEKKPQTVQVLPEDTLCPSCGKFVGAYERCPYCQSEMKTRFEVRLARRISVIGAIVGLIVLWYATAAKEVSRIDIGAIKENHNMALVKITGKVTGVRINEEKNQFTLSIDDGTGRMSLGGYDKLKRYREHFSDGLPGDGDMIEVVGNLSVTEKWGASMFLGSPARLKIVNRATTDEKDLDEVSPDDLNMVFAVKARIVSAKRFKSLWSVTLGGKEDTLPMPLFDSDFEKIPSAEAKKALTTPGSVVTVRAMVAEYKGKPQLKLVKPWDPKSVTVVSMGTGSPSAQAPEGYAGSPAPARPDAPSIPATVASPETDAALNTAASPAGTSPALTPEDAGTTKTVEGEIIARREFKTGVSLEIGSKGSKTTVWVAKKVADGLADQALIAIGSKTKFTGEVQLYKGKPQIAPENASDIAAAGVN